MSCNTELRVCMDIGSHKHQVGIGLSTGAFLEEFIIDHNTNGIAHLFDRINSYEQEYAFPVAVAMEAYNGHARPIDQQVLEKGYKLLNVNNHKLAQFKKVFPGSGKTDSIDMKKMFQLFCLQEHLPLEKNALQEVIKAPIVNNKLKRLSRRRRSLVNEKVSLVNRLQADIKAIAPGLLGITKRADNIWFLNFLTYKRDIKQLARLKEKTLRKIPGVGNRFLEPIKKWQENASFSDDTAWVGDMVIKDASRMLSLIREIQKIEETLDSLIPESEIARRLKTIPGFGVNCASEISGEIGTIDRFHGEASLALYLGVAVLPNSSGNYIGVKQSIHVNSRTKTAMMAAMARHINICPESKKYYDKKRSQGKKHNQAVRCAGRHMVRVIWSMLKGGRDYKEKLI